MKIVNQISAALIAAAALTSSAHASTFTVDAVTPIGSFMDTGIDLSASTIYNIWNSSPEIWSAGSQYPYSRLSNANGIPTSRGYGQLNMEGYAFSYGALVGEVGGTFFLVGASGTKVTGLSGELQLGYWDSYYPDNFGYQGVSVSSVPELSTWAMMLAGFAGLVFVGYSRRQTSAVA